MTADIDAQTARSPLKVTLLAEDYNQRGGTEAHVVALHRELNRAGMEVQVIAGTGVGAANAAVPGVTRIPGLRNSRGMPAQQLELVEDALVRFSPDVIHCHAILGHATLARVQRHAPLVRSVHNYLTCSSAAYRYFSPAIPCTRVHSPQCLVLAVTRNCGHSRYPRPKLGRYARVTDQLTALRSADAVIAYSQFVARDLRAHEVGDVNVIPLFHTDREPRPMPEPKRGGGRSVLFVGRLFRYKGVDVLLRAITRLDCDVVICGDGPELSRLRELARELGVDGRVSFPGWQAPEQLDPLYRDADVVVVPSVWPEPFGLVGLEAMSHAKPVVGSNSGGIPDWLLDEVNGLLFDPGDEVALARALQRLLDDPASCVAMGARGRQMLRERFSPEDHIAALGDVYRRVIAGRS